MRCDVLSSYSRELQILTSTKQLAASLFKSCLIKFISMFKTIAIILTSEQFSTLPKAIIFDL